MKQKKIKCDVKTITDVMLWVEELQTFCQVVAKRVLEMRRSITALEEEVQQLKGEKNGPLKIKNKKHNLSTIFKFYFDLDTKRYFGQRDPIIGSMG